MEPKKTLIAKSILAKYKNTGGIAILDYEIYCRAIIMKTIWHKNRYADQWNKIEDPNKITLNYSLLTYDQEARKIYTEEKITHSTNGARKIVFSHA